MAFPTCCGGVIGKLAMMTALGFAILFVGPIILAVGATVLPFALVGAMVYLPSVWIRKNYLRVNAPVPQRPVAAPVPLPLVSNPPYRMEKPERKPRQSSVLGRVVAEMTCGALVGGVLGVLAAAGHTPVAYDLASLGAGIGAIVGFVVGGTRPAPAERAPVV